MAYSKKEQQMRRELRQEQLELDLELARLEKMQAKEALKALGGKPPRAVIGRLTEQVTAAIDAGDHEKAKSLTSRLASESTFDIDDFVDDEESRDWFPLGSFGYGTGYGYGHSIYKTRAQLPYQRQRLMHEARDLCHRYPMAQNILTNYVAYTVGGRPRINCKAVRQEDEAKEEVKELCWAANRVWSAFLKQHLGHYTISEHVERTYRDGESFLRKFPAERPGDVPKVRFRDPEQIPAVDDLAQDKNLKQGIIYDPDDEETPIEYNVYGPGRKLIETISADQMLHVKVRADSNEPRGVSIFEPVGHLIKKYDGWLHSEVINRKVINSVVYLRKWRGATPTQVDDIASSLKTSETSFREGTRKRMKLRPGTVYDVNENFDLEPIQANKQYTDADTLGRNQRLHIAIGVGISEVMLTADSSNHNYASSLVAESPIVNHFLKEQDFWRPFLEDVWLFVMDAAVASGELPDNFHELIEPDVAFPIIIHRDRLNEIQGDTALVAAQGMSSQELSRRHNLDPEQMEEEISRRRGDLIPDLNLNGKDSDSDSDNDSDSDSDNDDDEGEG